MCICEECGGILHPNCLCDRIDRICRACLKAEADLEAEQLAQEQFADYYDGGCE